MLAGLFVCVFWVLCQIIAISERLRHYVFYCPYWLRRLLKWFLKRKAARFSPFLVQWNN